jgi:predicted amidohydrolase YtcJ
MSATLLVNGTVRTPAAPAAEATAVQAMLVRDGHVAWTGSSSEAATFQGPGTEVVDLQGSLVTPAFVDAHVHTTSTGLALTGLDLRGCPSLAAALSRLEDFCRSRRGVGVLLGHGWDETSWPEGRPPTRNELDRASYGGVVYLTRIDVHSAVASSALLASVPAVAGLPGYSADGLLSREAHHVARAAALGSLTRAQQRDAGRAALARAAQLGIGLVHELGGPEISSADDLAGVLALAAEGDGPEVVGYWGELGRDGGVDRARELGAVGAAGDLFADGALGSRTACLRSPYADAATAGFGYLDAEEVRDHVVACTRAGLQAGFHVIGDGALDAVTAGLRQSADVLGAPAVRAGRHRLEHVEMPDAGHLATLADLQVRASVQPVFDALWGGPHGMYAQRLGADRAHGMNPLAAMASVGVPLAFGSDSPVTPLGPWEAVRAATSHRTPGSSLTLDEAFAAHTVGGWRAAGVDDAGLLTVGAPASYAVWEAGPTISGLPDLAAGTPPPRCLRTVVRGRVVWSAPGAFE